MYEEEIHVGKLLLTQSEIWSLEKVGQGVLELLIGNQKVIDGQTDLQTDRPTDCHVQSNMPSLFRRGT